MINILFLAANPAGTTSLRIVDEVREIESKIGQGFELRQHWAVRVRDLQGLLLRYEPHIVHFSGHGSTTSEIILENDTGNMQPVSVRALTQLFTTLKDNIQCVVLNACYSENQARAIAANIDCVVGMSRSISDSAAISFAAGFYQALGFGRNIKTAFDLGCGQIDLESLGEQGTPQLLALNCKPEEIFIGDTKRKGGPDKSCEQESNIRSVEGVNKTSFTITNGTKLTLTVYWLDYQGDRQEYFKIEPNQTRKQQTYLTHPWLVADPGGKCMHIFYAPADVVIE